MGVFCPNCGAENNDSKTPCGQCGFKLSSVSAPKFKGTMMLNSNAEVQALLKAHQAKQEASESEKAPARTEASRSSQIPRPFGSIPRAAKGPLKGTMLGVAPQAGGMAPFAAGLRDPSKDSSRPEEKQQGSAPTDGSSASTLPSTAAAAISPAMQTTTRSGVPSANSSPPSAPSAGASSADRTQVSPSVPPPPAPDPGECDSGQPPGPVVSAHSPSASGNPRDVESAAFADSAGSAPADEPRPNPMALSEPELRSLVSPHAVRRQEPPPMTGTEWFLCVATLGVYALVRWLRLRRA